MSGASGIGGNNYSSYRDYGKLASGTRIQSAADDAAGLAISEKEQSQSNGLRKMSDGAAFAQGLLNISDGGLSEIHSYLQDIRELAVSYQNGLYSDSDKQYIRDQINQYMSGINDIAKNTSYNTMGLLDGSGSNQYTQNATLSALGLNGFNPDAEDALDQLDKALDITSKIRSSIGAKTNGLESQQRYYDLSVENHESAISKLKDLDMARGVSDMKKKQILEQMSFAMQKKKSENEAARLNKLFA